MTRLPRPRFLAAALVLALACEAGTGSDLAGPGDNAPDRGATDEGGGDAAQDRAPEAALPDPVFDSGALPDLVPGGEIVITGRNFGTDPAAVVVTLESTVVQAAEIVSVTDTRIVARVPSTGWCSPTPTAGVVVRVSVRGTEVSWPASMTGLAACGAVQLARLFFSPASVDDTLEVVGLGFDPDPARNVIRFTGAEARPLSVEPCPYVDYTNQQLVKVVVPAGARTGPLDARRDGAADWSAPLDFTLVPRVEITAAAGWEAGGVVLGGYGLGLPDPAIHVADEPAFNCASGVGGGGRHWCRLAIPEWVLSGSGFLSVRRRVNEPAGSLRLEVQGPQGTETVEGQAVSDTLAVFSTAGLYLQDPETVPGDTLTVRVLGVQLDSFHERASEPATLKVARRLLPGGTRRVLADLSTGDLDRSRGDVLVVMGTPEDHVLTGPGLWDGAINFRCDADGNEPFWAAPQDGVTPRLCVRAFELPRAGTFTIRDGTSGVTMDVRVHEGGVSGGVSFAGDLVAQEGAELAFGGGRLQVPAGALPLHEGSGEYSVSGAHQPRTVDPWDPEMTDGGGIFSVRFWPDPPELLKPVTVVLPYDAAGLAAPPLVGLQDPESGLFWPLDGVVDGTNHTATFVLPAGAYGSDLGALPGGKTVNGLLGSLVAWGWKSTRGLKVDAAHNLQVDYVTDPASSSYITDPKADEILRIAVATHDWLTGAGWTPPGSMVTIYVRDMGPASGVKGSTTKGVFGQPWVQINTNLPLGPELTTTVSHEVTHAFQRQVTTNLVTNWIDEASANAVPVLAFGAAANIASDIQAGADFPAVSFPATFNTGYDSDQAYAAGAWAVWLERKYGGSLWRIYEAQSWDPTAWLDARGTVAGATGASLASLVSDFATDYWTQAYDPVKGLGISHGTSKWTTWAGLSRPSAPGKYTSTRVDLDVAPFLSSLGGYTAVARAQGLPAGVEVRVFGDTMSASGAAGTPVLLRTLTDARGADLLGPADAYRTLRLVQVNFSNEASPDFTLQVVAPHAESVMPASGAPAGGYGVAVAGSGFGPAGGRVLVGGFPQAVTSWGDTSVAFTMMNAGTAQGDWAVTVETAEGATTNARTFTFRTN